MSRRDAVCPAPRTDPNGYPNSHDQHPVRRARGPHDPPAGPRLRDGRSVPPLEWFRVRDGRSRSEEHTSELQSLMRISYAVFCLKKKTNNQKTIKRHKNHNINKKIPVNDYTKQPNNK